MDDDLDTPQAVALLFTLIRRANSALDDDRADEAAVDWATISSICDAVGLVPEGGAASVPDAVVALARARDDARADHDYERADALRDEIEAAGFVVEDGPDGTRVAPAG